MSARRPAADDLRPGSVVQRSRFLLWVSTFAFSFLIALSGLAVSATDADEKQLSDLRHRIATLQGSLQEAVGKRDNLTRELQSAEEQIGRLARRLRVLGDRQQHHRTRLGTLRKQEEQQLELLQRHKAVLRKQVRAAYAMGRQERIKIFFNQQSPDTVSRVMAYYDYLNRARAGKLKEIEAGIVALREIQTRIVNEETKLHELTQQRLAEKQVLEKAQAARRTVIDSISAELDKGGQALEQLLYDEKRLQKLLAGIREALADVNAEIPGERSFQQLKGKLAWPAKGKIAATYGSAKIGGLTWDGILIGAPEGGEVRAIHGGRVAYADWLRGFGLLLIIDHGDGYMSLYGHNQSLFKETGDWVESGEPIALVGSTGGQRRSGVYFGIRHNGDPVDPVRWCRRTRGKRVG